MSSAQITVPGGQITVTMVAANPPVGASMAAFNPPVGASMAAFNAPVGVTMVSGNGTTPPLGFIGTGLRLPVATATKSGNNYVAGDMAMGMPPWEVDEIWFCFPVTAFTNSAAVACPNGYTLEGIGTRASGGARTVGLMDDASDSIVIDPSDGSMTYGRWVKFTPAAPIPANAFQVFSFAQYIPDGTFPRNRGGTTETVNRFGGTIPDERSQGSSSSMLSTLSGSTSYNNSAGELVWPCAAMARKPSGELSAISIGTSIGYGVNNTTAILRDNRGEFGFMSRGLDDNNTSKRISNLNWCIPGWNHVSSDTAKSHTNETALAALLWLMAKARALNAGRPLVDQIWSEHGTNSSGTQSSLRADYRAMFDLWRTTVGDADTPCFQAEMLVYAASSDGYATLGNQTPSAANAYPSGTRWLLNADIGGPDGDGDATANLRADGTIQNSFAPWKESAYDLTTNRDKFSVRAFNTTLAATYSGSGTLSLTAEPTVGDALFIKNGGTEGACIVLSYTGSGPYLVTPLWVAGSGSTYTSGSTVRSIWHDNNGLHPGPFAFDEYMTSLAALKVALGYEAPLAAPVFVSSSISGTAENGQVLTANASVTGNPTPTITYQWRNKGANISGETSSTITLDESGMGLVDNDTLSVHIVATNSQGSVSADPTVSYTGAPTSLYDTGDLAYISGTAEGDEIIDADSFRLCRESPLVTLLYGITDGGVNGAKRIRFNPSAYDGAASGITLLRIEVLDGATVIQDVQNTTARDFTHTFVNGSIRFRASTTGRGGRIDNLLITAA